MDPQKTASEYGTFYDRLMRQCVLIRWTHVALALVAAVVFESQRGFAHYAFWRSSGGAIVIMLALPTWPYLVSFVSVWGRTTDNWARPWIFCLIMILITMLACLWYLSKYSRENGLWGNFTVTLFQAGMFGFFGRWTFEDSFDEL